MSNVADELKNYWSNYRDNKKPPSEAQAAKDVLRIQWDNIEDVGHEISLKWLDPLIEGEGAECEYLIGSAEFRLAVDPVIGIVGGERQRRIRDYAGVVEKAALRKWHTLRGTPVTDRDEYQTEPGFKPPVFVWEAATIDETPRRRGPGKAKQQTSHDVS
jgi:hypothetical protein